MVFIRNFTIDWNKQVNSIAHVIIKRIRKRVFYRMHVLHNAQLIKMWLVFVLWYIRTDCSVY